MDRFPLLLCSLLAVLSSWALCGIARSQDRQSPKPSSLVMSAEAERIASMQRASLATVAVHGSDGQGGGSGVCISPDGYVLTNFHVTSPFGHRMRCGLNDGKMYESVVAGIDPTGDLAVVKMYGRDDFPAAEIGDSDQVRAGQWCFAVGNPFVLATNLQPTVTYGIVSGVRRYQYPSGTFLEYSDCIQTDAAINPGNSGGPLFNMRGQLIGINGRCSFEKRGRVNVGVGYAISIKQAMNFYWHLRSGRVVDHATLGFTVATDSKGRVSVSNILETSDAYRRGIRFGDEVLRIGDRDIATTNQLKNIVGIFPDQWRIPVRYRNEDGTFDTFVRLQSLHLASELEEIVAGEGPKPKEPPKRPGPPPRDQKKPEEEQPKEPSGKEQQTKEPIKDLLADRFEEKRGFSNYYFNRMELDRILGMQSSIVKLPNDEKGTFSWKWSGKLPAENESIAGECNGSQLTMKVGEQSETLHPTQGWQQSVKKRSNITVAMALRVWQLWHSIGPRKVGETVYLGRNPIVGEDRLYDTTRLAAGEVNCLVYTDPDSGAFRLVELYADNLSDPAEIYFERFEKNSDSLMPSLLRLQFGLEPQWIVKLENHTIADSQATKGL